MGLDIMGFRPCGFGLACCIGVLSDRHKRSAERQREGRTENIQKHERVREVFFLAIEILSSDFLYA